MKCIVADEMISGCQLHELNAIMGNNYNVVVQDALFSILGALKLHIAEALIKFFISQVRKTNSVFAEEYDNDRGFCLV